MTSEEFKRFMQNCKMSKKEMALQLGVTHQAVQLWLDGKRSIPETTFRLIKLFQKYPNLMKEF